MFFYNQMESQEHLVRSINMQYPWLYHCYYESCFLENINVDCFQRGMGVITDCINC